MDKVLQLDPAGPNKGIVDSTSSLASVQIARNPEPAPKPEVTIEVKSKLAATSFASQADRSSLKKELEQKVDASKTAKAGVPVAKPVAIRLQGKSVLDRLVNFVSRGIKNLEIKLLKKLDRQAGDQTRVNRSLFDRLRRRRALRKSFRYSTLRKKDLARQLREASADNSPEAAAIRKQMTETQVLEAQRAAPSASSSASTQQSQSAGPGKQSR